MNSAKVDEDDTSNCPDCQLQMLQQQQIQIQPPPPDNHQHLTPQSNVFNDHHNTGRGGGHYDHHQNVFDSCELRTACVEDFHNNVTYENRRSHNNTNSNPVYKGGTSSSGSGNINNASSSSSSVYNLVASTAAMTATVTLSNHNTNNANSSNELLSVPPNMSNPPCLTPLPLEACDLKSYCATCAVLDLPTNDKFFRSSLSRHSVYPPIFYPQAPPMPGFSPIPDCNSWGNSNDFGSYSYNPYPPQQATTTNDYYSSSTTPSSSSTVLPPSGGGHSFTENTSQVITSGGGGSCSFSFPPTVSSITSTSSSNNNCSTNNNENLCYKRESQEENGASTNKGGYIETVATTTTIPNSNNSTTPAEVVNDVMPICISSSSDDDSSDSGSFLSQNEVIVEDVDEEEDEEVDDDDEDEENINTSLNLCEVQSERNQKCTICQNPVLTECTSPQLANILENIHDEITAEDLDLSVSSGDIEIGGIEDEVVRDFNPKKSQNSPQITISRLAYLLNISPTIFMSSTNECSSSSENHHNHNVDHQSSTNYNNNMIDIETTMANFCAKCGKLTFMMDSLEKQLRVYTATLKQLLQPQSQSLNTNSPINPLKSSNLTTLSSTTSSGGVEDHNDDRDQINRIFPNTAVTHDENGDENNICCGDDDCPVERLSRTTHISSSKLLACKLTQTEPFIIIEKAPENLDFDNNMETTIPVINSTLTTGSSTIQQEGRETTTGKIIDSESEGEVEVIHEIGSSDGVESSSAHLEETAKEIVLIVQDGSNTDITMEEFENTMSNRHNCGEEDKLSPAIIATTTTHDQQTEISVTNFVPENTHNTGTETTVMESKKELEDQEINFSNNECLTCDLLEVSRKFYLCHECGVFITSKRTFETHCKRHHNELSRVCQICKKQFANEAALRSHCRIHTKEKPFPCPRCSKSFSTKSNMNAHHEICKDNILGEKRNEFLITGNDSNSIISPSFVMDKLTCDKCGVSFRLQARLASHQSKGCKLTALECSRCFKKFSKRSEMKAHLLVHDNVKPFTCQICQLSFTTKGNLVSHQRTHSSDKRFACTICAKSFNRKQALQLHYNRHNGIQPFCCEICNRKFFDPSNLQNHKKIHLKNVNVQLI